MPNLERENKKWEPLYYVSSNYIPSTLLKKKNKERSWKYGYDADNDLVVISKDGTIGDVYNIEGINIALPREPKEIDSTHNKWVVHSVPEDLKRIKSIFDWRDMDRSFKERYAPYI